MSTGGVAPVSITFDHISMSAYSLLTQKIRQVNNGIRRPLPFHVRRLWTWRPNAPDEAHDGAVRKAFWVQHVVRRLDHVVVNHLKVRYISLCVSNIRSRSHELSECVSDVASWLLYLSLLT